MSTTESYIQGRAVLAAARKGTIEDLQIILDQSRDEAVEMTRDEYSWTALHWAALRGSQAHMETLLHWGADSCARDNHGDQPLHVCCQNNNVLLVALLLDYDAELNAKGGHSQTPLMRAAQYGALEVVKYLLSCGADALVKDADGKTALDRVCERGNLEAAPAIRQALEAPRPLRIAQRTKGKRRAPEKLPPRPQPEPLLISPALDATMIATVEPERPREKALKDAILSSDIDGLMGMACERGMLEAASGTCQPREAAGPVLAARPTEEKTLPKVGSSVSSCAATAPQPQVSTADGPMVGAAMPLASSAAAYYSALPPTLPLSPTVSIALPQQQQPQPQQRQPQVEQQEPEQQEQQQQQQQQQGGQQQQQQQSVGATEEKAEEKELGVDKSIPRAFRDRLEKTLEKPGIEEEEDIEALTSQPLPEKVGQVLGEELKKEREEIVTEERKEQRVPVIRCLCAAVIAAAAGLSSWATAMWKPEGRA